MAMIPRWQFYFPGMRANRIRASSVATILSLAPELANQPRSAIEKSWGDFSEDRIGRGWMVVDQDTVKEYLVWLDLLEDDGDDT
jgi:hypothetical protein